MSEENTVTIDLTGSFYETDDPHVLMSNSVIEINDSITQIHSINIKIKKKVKSTTKRHQNRPAEADSTKKARKVVSLDCPICLHDLCTVPVASTSCGHVFCMACLKKSLKDRKTCPKCRQTLTGKDRSNQPLELKAMA